MTNVSHRCVHSEYSLVCQASLLHTNPYELAVEKPSVCGQIIYSTLAFSIQWLMNAIGSSNLWLCHQMASECLHLLRHRCEHKPHTASSLATLEQAGIVLECAWLANDPGMPLGYKLIWSTNNYFKYFPTNIHKLMFLLWM